MYFSKIPRVTQFSENERRKIGNWKYWEKLILFFLLSLSTLSFSEKAPTMSQKIYLCEGSGCQQLVIITPRKGERSCGSSNRSQIENCIIFGNAVSFKGNAPCFNFMTGHAIAVNVRFT
jgi:hypothetical protein